MKRINKVRWQPAVNPFADRIYATPRKDAEFGYIADGAGVVLCIVYATPAPVWTCIGLGAERGKYTTGETKRWASAKDAAERHALAWLWRMPVEMVK